MKHNRIGHLIADEQGRLILPKREKKRIPLSPGEKLYFTVGENGIFLHRPLSQLARIYVEPTNRCNLACKTCIRHSWAEDRAHMEFRVFEKILSAVDGLANPPTIFFGGFGEPLFHPEIIRMIKEAKAKRCRVELITNGVLLEEEMVRGLLKAGLDFLWVSIDGASPETYADVRLGNELPHIIRNLQRFRSLKYRFPARTPHLGIAFVLMKRNIGDLPKVIDLGRRLGAKRFIVTNVLPYSEAMKSEVLYTRSMSSYPPRFREIDFPRVDMNSSTANVLSDVFSRFEFFEFAGEQVSLPYDMCPFVRRGSTSVRFDGKVSPCLALLHSHTSYLDETVREIESFFVGDLGNTELLEIWNDSEYQRLRERLLEFDFSPCTVCNSCEFVESNVEDCFGNDHPACGGCLWAQGFIQCP